MFSRIFIERPRLAIVISVVLVFAGVLSLSSLPVAEYPEISPPQIQVSATYTGAGAEVVANTVAMPVESELNGLENVLYFSSTSDNSGGYSCSVTFKTGTDSDMAMVNVQNAIKRVEARLPAEVRDTGISVSKSSGDILAMFLFMTDGSAVSPAELSNYISTTVKDAVSRVDGVSSVSAMGGQTYAMRIWLDPLRMTGLGLSVDDISSAVKAQNVQAAIGSIGSEKSNELLEYKLNAQGRLKTADEFGDIIVRSDGKGSVVRLKDVARIELGAKTYDGTSTFNGRQAVGLAVYKNSDANALNTVKGVKAELSRLSERFPAGVSYDVGYDPTRFITLSLREIVQTLVLALLLVIGITYLFLQDWRATLIPAVAIPVSLLASFSFMKIFGYSINLLTMFGLILVIGSLVDDAIVVVENTQALMEREKLSAKEAALKCMSQITGAIIATTLVTVACYVPLAFYGGMVGAIYTQFAVTMCTALCLSTVVALTLSPAMCAILLRPAAEKPPAVFKPFNILLDKCRGGYLTFVKLLARRGILTLILLAGVCASIYFLSGGVPSAFLPSEDKGAFMCNIQLPPGASLARTESALEKFYEHVRTLPGVLSCITVSGTGMLSGAGENNGMCIVQLKGWDERKSKETQLQALLAKAQALAQEIPEARVTCFSPPAMMGLGMTGGTSFMLSYEGDVSAKNLSTAARQVAGELSAQPESLYAMTTYSADTPQLYLDLDREKAETLGLSANQVFTAIQSQLASLYINDFNMLGETFYVKMQSGKDNRAVLNDIRNIQIPADNGDVVPLSAVATIRFDVGPQQIQRFNKMTSADMTAQAAPGVSSGELMDRIEHLSLPEGYHIEWTGQSYQESQNRNQLPMLMALAMLFAYLFLVAQYESWMIPVPVILSVAFALLGAFIGLFITGSELNIYAQLGMVMLIGLAAKNAILMVEFSKTEREEGKSIFESAVNGASLRYRAVLMTAWSTLFGLFPLVVATGAGAGSRRAIGITTFSGMVLATLIGIVFTPALYAVFQHIREKVKAVHRKNRKSAEVEIHDNN